MISRVFAGILIAVGLVGSTAAEPVSGTGPVAEVFAARLVAALESGPAAWDALWLKGVRDSTHRELDLRTQSMFRWTEAAATVESARTWGTDVVVEMNLRGDVEWAPRAWGVASALWPLQCDENRERFGVIRREAWRLRESEGEWVAVERLRLRGFQILDLNVAAKVFPDQDALLVEATFYIRSRVDGLETARFFLDRRARIYRLTVDGEPTETARGGELGALGLDGFTPEVESSFRFPKPLAAGEEALVRFRVRSPLVHLEDDGIVTTLPLAPGAFSVRAWMPVFDPAHAAGGEPEAVQMERGWEVHWPDGAFAENAFSPARDMWRIEPFSEERNEEVGVRVGYETFGDDPSRDLDFILARPGTKIRGFDWNGRVTGLQPIPDMGKMGVRRAASAPRVFRWASLAEASSDAGLDPHPRSRQSLVGPLLEVAGMSSRDLSSELADLLPIDLDMFDEVSDEGDRGGDGADGDAQSER